MEARNMARSKRNRTVIDTAENPGATAEPTNNPGDPGEQPTTNGQFDPDNIDPRFMAMGKQLGNASLARKLLAIDDGEKPSQDDAADLLAASDKLAKKALTRYIRIRDKHDDALSSALNEYHQHATRSGKISSALLGE